MHQTERLILRPWALSDRGAVAALFGDADVMRFSDNGVLDATAQQVWHVRALQSPLDSVSTLCAIARKKDQKVIGYVSLRQDLARVGAHESELGFRLLRAAWGKGYATEAARGIIAWAKSEVDISRITAVVDPNNTSSVRVLNKIGMTYAGEFMCAGYAYPDHKYGLDLAGL